MTIGRPPKDDRSLSKERILALALHVLDEDGEKALSFRSLAGRLNVTPMAIAHHVGSRHDMLTGVVALVYTGVADAPAECTPMESLRILLSRYCERVIAHPNVALLIFADQSLFAGQVVDLTGTIRSNVAALVPNADEADTIVDLIVDYAHGFAISAAAHSGQATQGPSIDDFHRGLDWILSRL